MPLHRDIWIMVNVNLHASGPLTFMTANLQDPSPHGPFTPKPVTLWSYTPDPSPQDPLPQDFSPQDPSSITQGPFKPWPVIPRTLHFQYP